jgi:hypothetical protein
LSFQSTRKVRWVIYEQTGTSLIAKVDKVSDVSGGGAFVASPAFNFQLQAGKTYMFGLTFTGGGDVNGYYDLAPYNHPSFGVTLGQFSNSYASKYDYLDSFTHDAVFQLEITTTP